MRSETSKEEKSILRQPQQGKASDLYWACRSGDLVSVRELIASNTGTDINCLELNGSTALHAASFFGHANVVRLLLHQHGVMRHRRNLHGLTAYEESANDEIRQLFHRPSNSQRFCSDATADAQHLFTSTGDEDVGDKHEDDRTPKDWVEGHSEENDIRMARASANIVQQVSVSMILMRSAVMVMASDQDDLDEICDGNTAADAVQRLIDEHVTPSSSEYAKASELVLKYAKTKNVEHLLRLYSLETPFYKNLGRGNTAACLLVPLWLKLSTLKKRAYLGRSFRGLTMTSKDLRAYRWALKHKGSILTTQSFCSTSLDENVARGFMGTASADSTAVLMVFNFSAKCYTALQLFRLSDTLPSISDFEDEREVLVLPKTLFHVTDIKIDDVTRQHTIYLENVPPKSGTFTLLRCLRKLRNSKE